jgi:hypothetical protein
MQARQIVKSIVDALVAERRQEAPASMQQVCESIGNSLRHMHSAWTANQEGLGYNDPWRRLAFVCAHMAPNADNLQWLIYWLFGSVGSYAVELLNQTNELRICAIGGGPGTELLAVSKFLDRVSADVTSATPLIQFHSVDAENGWAPVLELTTTKIRERLANSPSTAHINIESTFEHVLAPYENVLGGQVFDVYLVNYVMSELRTPEDRAQFIEFMDPIVEAAPETAVFIALDMYREGSGLPQRTREVCASMGLRMLRNDRRMIRLPPEESPYDLEPYTSGLLEWGKWNLRHTSAVYWYVGLKAANPHPSLEAEIV